MNYRELGFSVGVNSDEYFVYFLHKYNLNGYDRVTQIKVYKRLLKEIKEACNDKYFEIHKGTPFFWIGWYSFLMEIYDEAVFYLDAAMAEDKFKHLDKVWAGSGAAQFFRLELDYYRNFFDESDAPELKHLLEIELDRFNRLDLNNNISLNQFINLFVDKTIKQNNTAIITTFYTFILEKEKILDMIRYRGVYGGSIEPMITHIFKGTLIFETLLKKHTGGRNLGDALNKSISIYNFNFDKCTPDTFEDIFTYKNCDSMLNAFCITYKLRNKTAHNLEWNDIFTDDNYLKIYHEIMNSIFYVIQQEYIE